MSVSIKTFFCVFFIGVLVLCALPAQSVAAAAQTAETTLEVKAKLDAFAKAYVARANATIKPNRNQVIVKRSRGQYIATFREVDLDSMTTEIYPSKAPGCSYIGHIVYLEKEYESTGKTRLAAQQGDFRQMRARRVRELFRYHQGQWRY